MVESIMKLSGANKDIDLTSEDIVSWKQSKCPWNIVENTTTHKCAIKNTSICNFFNGIERCDIVLCSYRKKHEILMNKNT
jgi:hypothetical protein